jgi:hypothetical protein
VNRKLYIKPLNRAFSSNYENLDEYKHESNFKGILKTLTLYDVIKAIERANSIMRENYRKAYKLYEYAGYGYYRENPSLTVMESVERVLRDCRIIA